MRSDDRAQRRKRIEELQLAISDHESELSLLLAEEEEADDAESSPEEER